MKRGPQTRRHAPLFYKERKLPQYLIVDIVDIESVYKYKLLRYKLTKFLKLPFKFHYAHCQ